MTEEYRPLTAKDKLAFFAMIMGMFMAVLDIQIVASSLPVIGAGLSASQDELSWVQTAYIIAEVIIIPITGFLARLLSTRISYFVAALGFTIMSVMCSMTWNIESMIVFRALQGFFGGAMIPTVFATSFIIFSNAQRATVSIIIGLTVTVAPTLGPTIGGYITEITSWHFMFLVNVLPGIFVCTAVFLFANFDEPHPELINNFDYSGIFLMIVSLGLLQYILEEGTPKGWFDSNLILSLTIIATSSFIALIWRELTFENPILDLKAFRNKNFSLGCIYGFVIGIGLYGAVYILPLFLFRVSGMDTFQIGIVMMVTGIFQFIAAPVAGKLYGKGIDRRVMMAGGMILFATGCYLNGELTPDSNYWELFIPQAFRGFALMFCFIPIQDIALGAIPKSEVQNASGLYNLTRNLGGAMGLAIINANLIDNTKIFSQYLGSNLSITDPKVMSVVNMFENVFSNHVSNPNLAAISMINNIIQRDAFIIAINNAFEVIGLMFILSIAMLPLAKNASGSGAQSGGH